MDTLRATLGEGAVATGPDAARWSNDWTGQHEWTPLCVARPADTAGVASVLAAAREAGVAVVPVSGNTGLAGGTVAEGAVMLSLDRMNRVRDINAKARTATVEAGVILSHLHEATAPHGLTFPISFGAKGSAMLGGMLSTNAGGSGVLRHGNTRDLVLGLEAVLPDGRVLDAMTALHKDNSGLDLRHLLIGAEGTLGVITAAVVKLAPLPLARATAMVAVRDLDAGLALLNRLQAASGGAVEACEYMDRTFMRAHAAHFPDAARPFIDDHDVTILIELASTAPRDATPGLDGQVPLAGHLETVLGEMLEQGLMRDAVVAQSEAQRGAMWQRREAAAEVITTRKPVVITDIAVPLDGVATFLDCMAARLLRIDGGAVPVAVAHLGDGNIHYAVWPSDAALKDAITEAVEDEVLALRGSFSAEHGIGTAKLDSMRRRKDPVALDVMRAIKAALDPDDLLNPGKLIPPR
ncbi:FAD-binding oxidoreductase [Citreimonas salinaria]|uniref:FAD/FMN-containing dehydrogenase n=1 Tax=Citreimonas salinaria TaxID=321339 RepID=A0A1H3M926_9RHOB|nr:FAD-binding oxidoreductase [Citreimonas salinaria]SDY73103.1 FAD/FMN-containing dehydrogenase [Citreimonas salinaria]